MQVRVFKGRRGQSVGWENKGRTQEKRGTKQCRIRLLRCGALNERKQSKKKNQRRGKSIIFKNRKTGVRKVWPEFKEWTSCCIRSTREKKVSETQQTDTKNLDWRDSTKEDERKPKITRRTTSTKEDYRKPWIQKKKKKRGKKLRGQTPQERGTL